PLARWLLCTRCIHLLGVAICMPECEARVLRCCRRSQSEAATAGAGWASRMPRHTGSPQRRRAETWGDVCQERAFFPTVYPRSSLCFAVYMSMIYILISAHLASVFARLLMQERGEHDACSTIAPPLPTEGDSPSRTLAQNVRQIRKESMIKH